jgi:hypothetical protein
LRAVVQATARSEDVVVMFLQVIGGIVVTVVAIGLLFYAWIRFKYGKWLDYAGVDNEPLQIHLNEDYSPSWRDEGDAAVFFADLRNCGFEPGKAYSVVEMENVKTQSLFLPPYMATIYSHPLVDCWVDLTFISEDEELMINVSNASLGETIKSPPENRKIYLNGGSAQMLFVRLKQEAEGVRGKIVNDSNYRECFEEAYRKEMSWRARQGGTTFEEFLGTMKAGNEKYKDEVVRKAFVDIKVQEFHRWHDAAMIRIQELDKHFLESVHEKNCSVILLPAEGNVEAYIRYISEEGVISDDQAESMVEAFSGQSDLKMVTRRIFEGFSNDLRPKKLRDIDFPVAAELYEFSY